MILSILEQALVALPLILGAYLILSLLKLPDLSIESAYLFGAVSAYLTQGLSLPLVLLSAMGGGVIVGTVVSILNQFLRIPYLLAAIVTNGLFHGFTQYCLGGSVVSLRISLPISELSLLISIALLLIALFGFGMRSQLGYSLAIYGNNPDFFRSHHLTESFVVFFGIIAGHACAGISGFLFALSNGFVDSTMNFGIILLCLTSLMIGKLTQSSRHPNLIIPLFGIAMFFCIQQFLLRMGLNLKFFNAFQALFVLAILTLGNRKQTFTLDHLGV